MQDEVKWKGTPNIGDATLKGTKANNTFVKACKLLHPVSPLGSFSP